MVRVQWFGIGISRVLFVVAGALWILSAGAWIVTVWGSKTEHKRLTEQSFFELPDGRSMRTAAGEWGAVSFNGLGTVERALGRDSSLLKHPLRGTVFKYAAPVFLSSLIGLVVLSLFFYPPLASQSRRLDRTAEETCSVCSSVRQGSHPTLVRRGLVVIVGVALLVTFLSGLSWLTVIAGSNWKYLVKGDPKAAPFEQAGFAVKPAGGRMLSYIDLSSFERMIGRKGPLLPPSVREAVFAHQWHVLVASLLAICSCMLLLRRPVVPHLIALRREREDRCASCGYLIRLAPACQGCGSTVCSECGSIS